MSYLEYSELYIEIYDVLNSLLMEKATTSVKTQLCVTAILCYGIQTAFHAAPDKESAVNLIKKTVETITTKFIKEEFDNEQ